MKNKDNHKNLSATQHNMYIAALRNNVVILKDGGMRAVIEVNSINFGLKSEEEQVGLVNSYVSFLNSIKYPLQIVIQSRKFNVSAYVASLQEQIKKQPNDLLRRQIQEYSEFIVDLVDMNDIMYKKFYVVVPHTEEENFEVKGMMTRFSELFMPAAKITLSQEVFLKKHRDLMMRVNNVMSGLEGIGLKTKLLNTNELVAMYYNIYNPQDDADKPPIEDFTNMRYDVV
ncbi:MAG TPA: hypothetical protein PLB38_03670 [bacterium]|nr:hypothetical protein [bacterium]